MCLDRLDTTFLLMRADRCAVGVKLDWGIFLLLPLLPVLLSPPNPINPPQFWNPIASLTPPPAAAMYSASVVLQETVLCLLLPQLTARNQRRDQNMDCHTADIKNEGARQILLHTTRATSPYISSCYA